jgi:hypothetical protein
MGFWAAEQQGKQDLVGNTGYPNTMGVWLSKKKKDQRHVFKYVQSCFLSTKKKKRTSESELQWWRDQIVYDDRHMERGQIL